MCSPCVVLRRHPGVVVVKVTVLLYCSATVKSSCRLFVRSEQNSVTSGLIKVMIAGGMMEMLTVFWLEVTHWGRDWEVASAVITTSKLPGQTPPLGCLHTT